MVIHSKMYLLFTFSMVNLLQGEIMGIEDISKCIMIVSKNLPLLRDCLDLTQSEFSRVIGISRQSLIEFEHGKRKITRPTLISIIAYFSLRPMTALILYEEGLYKIDFVKSLGYTDEIVKMMIKAGGDDKNA